MVRSEKIIGVDSEFGKELGFTSDKFYEDSYLWKEGNLITVSLIFVRNRRQGHFKALVNEIVSKGYDIEVPNAVPMMECILKKWGWVEDVKCYPDGEACPIWRPR